MRSMHNADAVYDTVAVYESARERRDHAHSINPTGQDGERLWPRPAVGRVGIRRFTLVKTLGRRQWNHGVRIPSLAVVVPKNGGPPLQSR